MGSASGEPGLMDRPTDKEFLAAADVFGTPLYYFSIDRLRANARAMISLAAGARLFYSVKACYLEPVLKTLLAEGFGLEVSSLEELALAARCGVGANRLRVHLICPTRQEANDVVAREPDLITTATLVGVDRLIASATDQKLPIKLGLRVAPPPLDSNPYLSTRGRLGIAIDDAKDDFDAALTAITQSPWARFASLHTHSQIGATNLDGHIAIARWMARLMVERCDDKVADEFEFCLGGGFASADRFGASRADFTSLADAVRSRFGRRTKIAFEPGRFLVEDAGFGIATVVGTHKMSDLHWFFLDMPSSALIPFEGRRFPARVLDELDVAPVPAGFCDALSTYTGIFDRDAGLHRCADNARVLLDYAGSYTISTMQSFMRSRPTIICVSRGENVWVKQREGQECWAERWLGGGG